LVAPIGDGVTFGIRADYSGLEPDLRAAEAKIKAMVAKTANDLNTVKASVGQQAAAVERSVNTVAFKLPPIDNSAFKRSVDEAKGQLAVLQQRINEVRGVRPATYGVAGDTYAVRPQRLMAGTDGSGRTDLMPRPQFSADEQQTRNVMAAAIRSMRAQAREANIAADVRMRLFGADEVKRGIKDIGDEADAATKKAVMLGKAISTAMIAAKALEVAADIGDVAAARASGDAKRLELAKEQVRDSIRQLPVVGRLGDSIGRLADQRGGTSLGPAGVALKGLRTGVARLAGTQTSEEIREFDKQQAELEKRLDAQRRNIERMQEHREDAKQIAREAQREMASEGLSPTQRALRSAIDRQADFDEALSNRIRGRNQGATSEEGDVQRVNAEAVRRAREANAAAQFDAGVVGARASREAADQNRTNLAQINELQLRNMGQIAQAERTAFMETLAQREDGVRHLGKMELDRVRAVNSEELKGFDERQRRERELKDRDVAFGTAQSQLREQRRFFEADQAGIAKGFDEQMRVEKDPVRREALNQQKLAALHENEAVERRRIAEATADTEANIREGALRAAGQHYRADVESYKAAMEARVRAATTAEEAILAQREKAAGEQAMATQRERERGDVNFETRQLQLRRLGQNELANARDISMRARREIEAAAGDPAMQQAILARTKEELLEAQNRRAAPEVLSASEAFSTDLRGPSPKDRELNELNKQQLEWLKTIAKNTANATGALTT